MFNHFLDVNLTLLDMVWNEGYEFDCVTWPDDMGYKNNQFFSVKLYRELLKPVHSVPPTVSLENFRHIVDLAKKLGRY